jgi:hypothetical protein
VPKRTYQRAVYRPGELAQCDLVEPRRQIAVGHAQTHEGYVEPGELGWSSRRRRAGLLKALRGPRLRYELLSVIDRSPAGEGREGPGGRSTTVTATRARASPPSADA